MTIYAYAGIVSTNAYAMNNAKYPNRVLNSFLPDAIMNVYPPVRAAKPINIPMPNP